MNNQKSDGDFSNTLKEMIAYLYKATNQEQKDLAYTKIIELINARFGACPRCGHINTGGKFCSECGQELAGEVISPNSNVESIDYLIAKKNGKSMTVLCIEEDEVAAITSLRRHCSTGINASLFKRTIEKVNAF